MLRRKHHLHRKTPVLLSSLKNALHFSISRSDRQCFSHEDGCFAPSTIYEYSMSELLLTKTSLSISPIYHPNNAHDLPNCYSSKPRYHADPIYHSTAPSLTSQAPDYQKLYFSKYNFSCGFLLTRRKIYCRIRRHKGNGVFERKLEGAFFFSRIKAIETKAKASFVLSQKVSLPFLICRLPAFDLAASVLTDPHSHLQEPAYTRKEYYYE